MTATNAAEILRAVIEEGRSELERASAGLAFSGFVAGLCISFGAASISVFATLAGGVGVVPMLFYPIGFLIVILGQAELFTAHTVGGLAATLKEFGYWRDLLRLWAVVFVFNLLGTALFAALVVFGEVPPPSALGFLFELTDNILEVSFWGVVLKGVFGGWLVALMAWLVAASGDTIAQFFSIYTLALLLPAAGLPHCIADSAEFLVSVISGHISFSQYLGGFLIPSTVGNMIGGVGLVTLLNWGQVLGSKKEIVRTGSRTEENEG